SAELVWESGRDKGKKPIPLEPTRTGVAPPGPGAGDAPPRGRVQGKLTWDIAELQVPSGGEGRYWIEAKDNDTCGGPNLGRPRELPLKVVSPRERHEETLGRQQALAEKILRNLGGRLTLGDEPAARDELGRQLRESVVELGTIGAAFEKDPHASDALRKALSQMRERPDKLANAELRLR